MFQKGFDTLRVIGNNAVHPLTIDTDNVETSTALLRLINNLIQFEITDQNELNSIYNSLPQQNLDGIERRDKNSSK